MPARHATGSELDLLGAITVIISFTVFASFEVALWQVKQVMQSKKADLQLELQVAKSEITVLQNDLNVAIG